MDLQLDGKTALVTGASSGLGLGCARALAAEGARVVLSARGVERLESAAGALGMPSIAADMSDLDDRARLVEQATGELGHIDIVVANAGGPPPGDFASTDFDAYQAAVDLNLLPTVDLCKQIVPSMQERGWGRVIAITSTSVREPIDQLILSNTARAGVTAFLKTLARQVAADGITVNSLQPGLHATPRLTDMYDDLSVLAEGVPARKIGDPDDFGRIAAFLCSPAAQFVTGTALAVDGGATRGLQ